MGTKEWDFYFFGQGGGVPRFVPTFVRKASCVLNWERNTSCISQTALLCLVMWDVLDNPTILTPTNLT